MRYYKEIKWYQYEGKNVHWKYFVFQITETKSQQESIYTEYLQRDDLCSDIQREKVLYKDAFTITTKNWTLFSCCF